MSGRVVCVWVVAAVLAGGCGLVAPSNPNPVCVANAAGACMEIDGFPVGQMEADCGSDGLACGKEERLAYLAVSMREPALGQITGIAKHSVDMARVCGPVLCVYSSYNAIFVFRLADGTLRAAGYQCQGVGPCFGTLHWGDFAGAVGTE